MRRLRIYRMGTVRDTPSASATLEACPEHIPTLPFQEIGQRRRRCWEHPSKYNITGRNMIPFLAYLAHHGVDLAHVNGFHSGVTRHLSKDTAVPTSYNQNLEDRIVDCSCHLCKFFDTRLLYCKEPSCVKFNGFAPARERWQLERGGTARNKKRIGADVREGAPTVSDNSRRKSSRIRCVEVFVVSNPCS